ncbi:MAG: hypothetical protein LBI45_08430 [Bacteroidales bacterium]|jgi:hypothetical protein|nr:hypothetical protein [Bacteroidales bacterium]
MSPKLHHKLIILFLHIIFANTILAQINTSLPVGAIPGVVDVTSMGAATYTIPIEVVPGTQGMQPNLSIVYNSQGDFGLLGMKWDLAGISAITRCRKTPYFDDVSYGIKFTGGPYMLDGERLIAPFGTNYLATEQENFTRIYSYGDYFILYADDGTVIEYGNTSDSKQRMANNNNVLSWYVNKVTDANGNYMTFTYSSGNNKGEKYIHNINYTYNDAAGLYGYAKVVFNYKDIIPDTLGINTRFISGSAMA